MSLTVGSLFSGIGGFDLGFERAGLRPAWMCEIDKACQGVLGRHWPGVLIYDDVTQLSADGLVRPDVLCGGFPCQDVSVAGRRAGLAGERSGLWYEFHRIIEGLRPQWVVIENVPGLLSSNGGRDFAVILRGLVECGYGVAWRVCDAQYFGVAQRRRRVFIVGSLNDGRAAQVLFERESLSGDTPPRRETGAGVVRSLANGAGSNGGYRYDPNGEEYIVIKGAANGRAPENGPQYGEILDDGTCYTLNTIDRHAVAFAWQQGDDSKFNANGRGRSWITRAGDYAAGLSANRHDAVAGQFGVRRLTPVECERLQGFPDDFTAFGANGAPMSDSARYRMLGNAVCVNVAEWIGRRVLAVT